MDLHYFTAQDGARLAYRDEGDGLVVLALAGLTRNSSDFDYVAPHLNGIRLIRLDYRGRGASEWTGADTYSVPQESADALALLDHLGIAKAAILGTSRGGLVGMFMAATAKDRMLGLCLVDIGPEIDRAGLDRICDYVGRNPTAKDHDELANKLPGYMPGFTNVPPERWLIEARRHYIAEANGLRINYDPALREPFLAGFQGPLPDAWPLFDLSAGLPLALIRGANSDLLPLSTAQEMQRRRPDMVFANVPDRAHVPFLDEPESLDALKQWIDLILEKSAGETFAPITNSR